MRKSNWEIIRSKNAEGVKKKDEEYGSVDRESLELLKEKFAVQPDLSKMVCGHYRFQDCDCNQESGTEEKNPEAWLAVLALSLEELKQTIQAILDDQSHQGTGCIYGLHVTHCLCKSMRKHPQIVEAYKATVEAFNLILSLYLQKNSQV